MIFQKHKAQVQNLKKNKLKEWTLIPPILRFLYLLVKLCSLCTEPTNDCTVCLHFKAWLLWRSLPKINKASLNKKKKNLEDLVNNSFIKIRYPQS